MEQPTGDDSGPVCPDCRGQLQVIDASAPHLVRCDTCGRETFLGADADSDDLDAAPEALVDRDDELDGHRIRQLASARRAAYRARSYAVIAGIVSAVAAGDLAYHAAMRIGAADWGPWTITYMLFAIVTGIAAFAFFRRAAALHREATQQQVFDPAAPPDFSSLSDGGDKSQDLENIR